jgi:hypothetical protein
LADRLDEAARQLRVELATRWEANAELEALRTSAARIWDMVLDNADGSSSLTASMSTAVELPEGWIDATTTKSVRWRTHSTLVAVVSYFPELKSKL